MSGWALTKYNTPTPPPHTTGRAPPKPQITAPPGSTAQPPGQGLRHLTVLSLPGAEPRRSLTSQQTMDLRADALRRFAHERCIEMGVALRAVYVTVLEQLARHVEAFPGEGGMTGIGVPEIVEAECSGQPCRLLDGLPAGGDVAARLVRIVGRWKDQKRRSGPFALFQSPDREVIEQDCPGPSLCACHSKPRRFDLIPAVPQDLT